MVGFIGSQVPRNGRSSRLSAPGTPRPRRAYRARICSALRRTPVARTLRHSPVLVVLVVLLQINEGTCELAARRLGSLSGLSEKSPTVVTPSPGPNSGQYSPACTGQGQGRGGSSVHSLRGVENTLPITTHAPSSADVTYPAPDKRRTASSLQVPNPVESTLSRSFCAPRAPGDAGRPGRLAPGCPSYYMPASPSCLTLGLLCQQWHTTPPRSVLSMSCSVLFCRSVGLCVCPQEGGVELSLSFQLADDVRRLPAVDGETPRSELTLIDGLPCRTKASNADRGSRRALLATPASRACGTGFKTWIEAANRRR